MVKWGSALLGVLLLASCGHTTVQGLRDHPVGMVRFDVAQAYQSVYHTIVTHAQTCYATWGPDSNLFPDTQTGMIILSYRAGAPFKPMAIEVQALDASHTQVSTYYGWRAWETKARAVERWVRDTSNTACDI